MNDVSHETRARLAMGKLMLGHGIPDAEEIEAMRNYAMVMRLKGKEGVAKFYRDAAAEAEKRR